MTYHFAILYCPRHKFWAISLDRDDGVGSRLTHAKCCGRWEVVKNFADLTASDLVDIRDQLTSALETLDDPTKGRV